jgi:6-phosphogluconolactonase
MAQGTPDTVVYVSNAGDPSISVLAMDRTAGDVDLIEKTAIPGAEEPSPTSMPLALSADRRFLHAALRSEPFTAASFAIDPESGRLRHLGNAPLDASMAYIATDRTGRWLIGASYPAGKLAVNAIDAQGRITAPPSQVLTDRPKAHSVLVDSSNQYVYSGVVAQDITLQLKLDAAIGRLSPNTPDSIATKPGAGPRHLAMHPSGRYLYLITETTAMIGVYAVDKASGALKELQFVDMLAAPPKEQPAAADLHITPDGHFLYGGERHSNILAGYRVEPDKGTLTLIGRTETETTPRGFGIEPRGKFLLAVGLESHNMTVYAIRPNGSLEPIEQQAARCRIGRVRRSALAAHEQGDVGEEHHSMDYLTYAHLRLGRSGDAEQVGKRWQPGARCQ